MSFISIKDKEAAGVKTFFTYLVKKKCLPRGPYPVVLLTLWQLRDSLATYWGVRSRERPPPEVGRRLDVPPGPIEERMVQKVDRPQK